MLEEFPSAPPHTTVASQLGSAEPCDEHQVSKYIRAAIGCLFMILILILVIDIDLCIVTRSHAALLYSTIGRN